MRSVLAIFGFIAVMGFMGWVADVTAPIAVYVLPAGVIAGMVWAFRKVWGWF